MKSFSILLEDPDTIYVGLPLGCAKNIVHNLVVCFLGMLGFNLAGVWPFTG